MARYLPSLSLISTTSYLFPVLSGCHTNLLSEVITESSRIMESTGIGNFCHGIILCLQQFCRRADPVLEKILFGRNLCLPHEDLIQIRSVHTYIIRNILNPEIVGIIVGDIFKCPLIILFVMITSPAAFRPGHTGKQL